MVVIAVIPVTTMIKIISDLVTPIKNSKSRKDNKEKKNKTIIQKQRKRDKGQTKRKKNGNARKSENERKSEREILKTDNIPHNISIRFLKYELSKN